MPSRRHDAPPRPEPVTPTSVDTASKPLDAKRSKTTQRKGADSTSVSLPSVVPAPVPTKPSGAMRLSKPSRPSTEAKPVDEKAMTAPTVEVRPADTEAPIEPDAEPATTAEPDRRRTRLLTALGVVAVLLLAATTLLAVAWYSSRESGPLTNQAFADGARTSELVGQVTNAVVTVYSYDYTTLPENEAAAKAVITGDFTAEFDKTFQPVKDGATKQMTVLNTTVKAASVSQLQGDRARLLMMVDQTGTKGPAKEPTAASSRLAIDALWTDGRWKISGVTPE